MGSRSAATLSLLCVLLGALSTARSQIVPNAPSPPRTISGVVLNSVTGRPIPRALVQAGQYAMLTDGDGRFEFRDITFYNVFPYATKPGYFYENSGGMAPWSPAPQNQTESLELKLVPEAILSGRLTDATGAPLEGVPVTLRTLAISNGLKHWEQRAGATTNAEGEFRIAELQAGEYQMQTALKLDGPPEGEAAAGYAPVTYPENGANGAGALQVHAGDQLQADMSTRLEKLYRVSIVVNGVPEGEWPNITARTAGGVDLNPVMQRDTRTGELRTLLPSGSFELRAQAYLPPQPGVTDFGRAGLQLTARQEVTVADRPVRGVRMTLEPMATLSVEVGEEKTAPSQTSDTLPAQFNFVLLPADADANRNAYSTERWYDRAPRDLPRDGPLLIRNIPPGRYFLQAQGPQPWYAASAVCGGTDLTREPLTITGSAAGCALRVVLRDDVASLHITVSDDSEGRPAPAFIYVAPLNNLTRDVQMFPTGPDGKASLESIAPGQYLLLATHHRAQELAFRDAESLHRYETEGRRVDLSPGASAEIQLDALAGEP